MLYRALLGNRPLSYKISAIFIRRSFDELYDSMLELFFVIVLIGRQ
jgi:hypothetical protein